jgi:hypothetical protein
MVSKDSIEGYMRKKKKKRHVSLKASLSQGDIRTCGGYRAYIYLCLGFFGRKNITGCRYEKKVCSMERRDAKSPKSTIEA